MYAATTNVVTEQAVFAPDVVESTIAKLNDAEFFHDFNGGHGGFSITRYSRQTGLVIGWIAK